MTITHQGSTGSPAASAQGTTSISVAYPSGVAADRIAILVAAVKLSGATFGTVTDFNLIGTQAGGTGASANDAGTTRVGVWYKILTGSETGSVTVTNDTGVSSAGAMSIYSTSLGAWATPAFVAGADTGHAANWSAACGAWGATLAADDRLVVANSTDTDTVQTITAPTVTQTSATFGTVTQRSASRSTSGTDSGCYSWDASVTTGSANAPTWTHTSATSTCGATLIVALREVASTDAPAEAVAITATSEIPAAGVSPNAEGVAITAAALDATVEIGGGGTNAQAECAEAIVTAEAASASIDPNAEGVAVTAIAEPAAASIDPNAEAVAITATAEALSASVDSNAGAVGITASVDNPAAGVDVNAEAVGITVEALDATIQTTGSTNAPAECATATAEVGAAWGDISAATEVATVTASAETAAAALEVLAEAVAIVVAALDAEGDGDQPVGWSFPYGSSTAPLAGGTANTVIRTYAASTRRGVITS